MGSSRIGQFDAGDVGAGTLPGERQDSELLDVLDAVELFDSLDGDDDEDDSPPDEEESELVELEPASEDVDDDVDDARPDERLSVL